jgi:hypothetical protein
MPKQTNPCDNKLRLSLSWVVEHERSSVEHERLIRSKAGWPDWANWAIVHFRQFLKITDVPSPNFGPLFSTEK